MDSWKNLKRTILLFVFTYAINAQELSSAVYNVMNYGAVADGQTDSTQVSSNYYTRANLDMIIRRVISVYTYLFNKFV